MALKIIHPILISLAICFKASTANGQSALMPHSTINPDPHFNLISNSGFESAKTYGDTSSMIPAAIDGNLSNWFTSTGHGNARYYHANSKTFRCPGCPGERQIQYRGAHSGNAYVDLTVFNIAFENSRDTFSLSFDAATLCTQLGKPLVKGKKYQVEMFVRLDSVNAYALNHIAVTFNDTTSYKPPYGAGVLALFPDGDNDSIVYFRANGKMKDRTLFLKKKLFLDKADTWQHVSAIYVAKGGEKYLSIGGLSNQTIIEPVKRKLRNYQRTPDQFKSIKPSDYFKYMIVSPNINPFIIYHIDDVSVSELDEI